MSYEDIVGAQRRYDKMEAARPRRCGRKRKNSASASWPQPRRKSRAAEVKEAREEIKALGMEKFCSVFDPKQSWSL
jgi:hypothetical protein